ncbi:MULTISPECIES: glycoside hydrolase family 2 protein [Proteiniphilum]
MPEFSKAGFFEVKDSGRDIFNFNVGWRFYKGEASQAELPGFDDSDWELVNCPHGLEWISTEASGCNNYQGEAWYRKHFTIDPSIEGKVLNLYFEAVMGKCKVWLDGELLGEHFGGYLPFSVELTGKVKAGEKHVLAVWADNSNDPDYPPGKAQDVLDFSYFGGIYRDVWLIATNHIYVSDANRARKVAGGGLFARTSSISDNEAVINVQADIRNEAKIDENVLVQLVLKSAEGEVVSRSSVPLEIGAGSSATISREIKIKGAKLWTPDDPYLYKLEVLVLNKKKQSLDGVATKVGVRIIDFRGKDGFYLNNEPYQGKLVGANRHQDHAYVGNALPNLGQWLDACILKEAGCDIVRAAHYPVDPAFMDACDALGLFYIVATPGWQFWNDKPIFAERIYEDIRNMVRRDRNHPCVLMWEPILNETWYPVDFARIVHNIVHEECPGQGVFTVCDWEARGQENFDVIYSHPFQYGFWDYKYDNTPENVKKMSLDYEKEDRCFFNREWGDCVDNWNSHNSPSRVSRGWGEHAQLVQVKHYSNPDYLYTCWEALYQAPRQHVGGALWHSFDHQRGYHPDPFYGGIADVFRQPKYSYYLFASQRDVSDKNLPMVYIAHEMTPFSEKDVTVFTNCDEVRLIVLGKDTLVQKPADLGMKMPHPVVVFKDVFDFMDMKELYRKNNAADANMIAEGLINGKVVARYLKKPALRPAKIVLTLENKGVAPEANGSDFVTVVASVTDAEGNVKRLNNSSIRFEVEGEGEILGGPESEANPRKVEWGTAPVLIRSTLKPGLIKVRASVIDEGVHTPAAGELIFETVPAKDRMIYSEEGRASASVSLSVVNVDKNNDTEDLSRKVTELETELRQYKLKEVERQQQEFEGK